MTGDSNQNAREIELMDRVLISVEKRHEVSHVKKSRIDLCWIWSLRLKDKAGDLRREKTRKK